MKRNAYWVCMQFGATFHRDIRLIQSHSLHVCVYACVYFNLIRFYFISSFQTNMTEQKCLRLQKKSSTFCGRMDGGGW